MRNTYTLDHNSKVATDTKFQLDKKKNLVFLPTDQETNGLLWPLVATFHMDQRGIRISRYFARHNMIISMAEQAHAFLCLYLNPKLYELPTYSAYNS
jgi:hypothetical protein